MPVTVIPCSQKSAKKKTLSRKRRQNENEGIHELASLVPLSFSQRSGLIPSNGGKPQTNSVLRLTTTFLKLQSFIKDASPLNDRSNEDSSLGRVEEGIDGFLIVLDKDANILYVSETIAGHVGLIQQDVIGQSLADITHPEFSSNITECLKPSLIVSTSLVDEYVVSQHKQFFVKLKPAVSYSTSPSHRIVQMCGTLKVQLSPPKSTSSGQLKFIEPTVIGFIGECRVVESAVSILEISIPHSTYTMTRTPDLEKIISIEASVKEILGYDPKVLCADGVAIKDFIHPEDLSKARRRRKGELMKKGYGISPFYRFLTSSGEWVWQQVEAKLHYKDGTSIPHFWEAKIRVIGQWGGGGNLKYVEQRDLHQCQGGVRLHNSDDIILPPAGTSTSSNHHPNQGASFKMITDSLKKSTRKPESVLIEPCGRNAACKMQNPQCRSVSSNDSELSPDSTAATVESSSPIVSTVNRSPIAPSTTQLSVPTCSSVSDSGTKQCVSDGVSEMVACVGEQSAGSRFCPQVHVDVHIQQESASSPVSSLPNQVEQRGVQSPLMSVCSTVSSSASSSTMMASPQQNLIQNPDQFLNSISDCGPMLETCLPYNSNSAIQADFCPPPGTFPAETNPMLHTTSSHNSVPPSIPFQNPNFTLQAPLNDPNIPSSFDFSNALSPSFIDSFISATSVSTTCTGTQGLNFDVSNMLVNRDDSFFQQLVDEVSMMEEPSHDTLAATQTRPARSTDPMFSFSHSNPQTNLISDSNFTASLQDSMFCNSTHLSADLASQALQCHDIIVDHDSQSSHCSYNPEVQDILQQFM